MKCLIWVWMIFIVAVFGNWRQVVRYSREMSTGSGIVFSKILKRESSYELRDIVENSVPWIVQERLADHHAISAGIFKVGLDVVPNTHIAIADHWNTESLFEDFDLT